MTGNLAMSAPCQTLTDLLSPFDRDAFFCNRWERQPLHLMHNNPRRFSGLVTRRDIWR